MQDELVGRFRERSEDEGALAGVRGGEGELVR